MSGYSGSLRGLPGVVLVNVSPAYVRQVREQLGPDKTIVVRWEQSYQPLDDPERNALDWYCAHKYDMLLMTDGGKDRKVLFQGYNEVPGAKAEAYYWFENTRSDLMHADGIPVGLFAWSVGECDLLIWPLFASLIRKMRPEDAVLLHEYWVDTLDIANPWHCARWQLVPELKGARTIVCECGRDKVEGRGEGGWRKTCDGDTIRNELVQYDGLLQRYPNVEFAAMYGCGWVTPDWAAFDSNELVPWVIANTEPGSGGAPTPVPAPEPEPVKPKVCLPMKNVGKAWYAADQLFGKYDAHPEKAEDLNLETGGNTDLGEVIVAPFDGVVLNAEDYGRGYGGIVAVLSFESLDKTCDLNLFKVRHLDAIAVKRGDVVKMGQTLGTIGTAGGAYSAHAHIELIIVPIPTPKEKWYESPFLFVRPTEWFAQHGIPRSEVERIRKYDGK